MFDQEIESMNLEIHAFPIIMIKHANTASNHLKLCGHIIIFKIYPFYRHHPAIFCCMKSLIGVN